MAVIYSHFITPPSGSCEVSLQLLAEHFSYSELGYPLRKCEQLWIKMLLLECNCVFVSKLEVLYPFPSSPTIDHRFDQEMKDNHMIKGQDIFLKLKTSFLSLCRNGAG